MQLAASPGSSPPFHPGSVRRNPRSPGLQWVESESPYPSEVNVEPRRFLVEDEHPNAPHELYPCGGIIPSATGF